ncbi:acyltransferase family protein [Chromobacterium vaccinii]|uniref:acyltransferase family protein n=1 Tax=Chromobacterium vaccinii TaxID=1108595 RepID=UPI000E1358F4|nr:acyltransferase [Chromobacterium vaccinii]SUX29963.1 O-acetyltransferase OatA [Chromobacterium vaccinii]
MTTNAQSSSTLTRLKVKNIDSLRLETRDIQLTYRPDIDGLRAIAILLVLAFHAFPSLCPSGFVGVDVFFVISGFLITQILIKVDPNDKSALLTFYSRRVRRIFPALIMVLLSVSVYGYFALLPNDFSLLIKYVAAGSSFISNIVAWQNSGYFNKSTELAPLVHLWSLAIEEQFYIFWPVVFLGLRNRLPFNYLKHCIAILLLLSLSLCLVVTYKDQTQAYYSPFVRAWELLAGAWLAHRSLDSGKLFPTGRVKALFITIFAVASLVGSSFYIDKATFPGVWALMPISAAVLIVAYAQISWVGRFLSMPMMVYIGRISYPLYLWHWPLLAYLRIENPNPYWLGKLSALAISFS